MGIKKPDFYPSGMGWSKILIERDKEKQPISAHDQPIAGQNRDGSKVCP